MAWWFSYFYQSGMSGQSSIRLPNGDDLPLPNPRSWGGVSANVEVDFANVPQPAPLRIHYLVKITPYSERMGTGHIGRFVLHLTAAQLTGRAVDLARSQGMSMTVGRYIRWFAGGGRRGRLLAGRLMGPIGSLVQSSPIAQDNFLRMIDGDKAVTYIISP